MDETEEISRLRCIFLPCHETLNEDILSAAVGNLAIAIENDTNVYRVYHLSLKLKSK